MAENRGGGADHADGGARLEAGLIAVGIVLGCQVLCLAVPVGTL